MDFPGSASSREPACQCRSRKRHGFSPWFGKISWRRAWQPTPVFLPGESHGQRNLMGYSLWGRKRVRHDLGTKQQWIVSALTKYLSSQGALMRWVPTELNWPFTQKSNFCSCQLIPPLACNGLFVLSLGAVLWHKLQEALKATTFCLTDISSGHHTCQDSSRCRVLRHTLGWGEVWTHVEGGRGIW